jgi:hypothetical protein
MLFSFAPEDLIEMASQNRRAVPSHCCSTDAGSTVRVSHADRGTRSGIWTCSGLHATLLKDEEKTSRLRSPLASVTANSMRREAAVSTFSWKARERPRSCRRSRGNSRVAFGELKEKTELLTSESYWAWTPVDSFGELLPCAFGDSNSNAFGCGVGEEPTARTRADRIRVAPSNRFKW